MNFAIFYLIGVVVGILYASNLLYEYFKSTGKLIPYAYCVVFVVENPAKWFIFSWLGLIYIIIKKYYENK